MSNPTAQTSAITLRCEVHRHGRLTQHVADVDGFRVEAHQVEQAALRADGTWFLTIAVADYPLSVRSQHRTLADARAHAHAVIAAAGANASHAQLLAAVAAIVNPAQPVDLDVDQDIAEPATGPIVVVPCGAQKLDEPAPAGQLYRSQHFQLVLRAASRLADEQAGRVLILSALHGLVDPATVLDPYNVKMGDPESIAPAKIAEQLRAIRPTSVTALLPKAYRAALEAAGADVVDLYANAPGIGYQRGVAARILAA